MKGSAEEAQFAGFLGKYTPEIAALATEILATMRALLPGSVQIVYDNYNALVIGFGPNERASDIIFSIALYPRWVNLFFAAGALLPDPNKMLRGSGKHVRSIKLKSAADLDLPAVRDLMAVALKAADPPLDAGAKSYMVIRSVSEKQRARRPR